MELLISILTISLPAVVVIDFAGLAEKLKYKWYYLRYTEDSPYEPFSAKPFDCSGCLSFWLYLVCYGSLSAPVTSFVAACGAVIVTLIIRKLIL